MTAALQKYDVLALLEGVLSNDELFYQHNHVWRLVDMAHKRRAQIQDAFASHI